MPRRRSSVRRQPRNVVQPPVVPAAAGDLFQYGGRAHVVPEAVMKMLATVADTADAHAGNDGHAWRVAAYVDELARLLGLEGRQVALIADAARVHDMGLIDLPADLLTKPGPLTEQEWALIRSHVTRGAERLSALPETAMLCELVVHHHERFDGHGYPDGLAGAGIPFGARVIAVADSFDGMTHAHAYKSADFIAQSLDSLVRGAGSQWDAEIVTAFASKTIPHLMRTSRLMVSSDGSFDHSFGRL